MEDEDDDEDDDITDALSGADDDSADEDQEDDESEYNINEDVDEDEEGQEFIEIDIEVVFGELSKGKSYVTFQGNSIYDLPINQTAIVPFLLIK